VAGLFRVAAKDIEMGGYLVPKVRPQQQQVWLAQICKDIKVVPAYHCGVQHSSDVLSRVFKLTDVEQ
jgi:hypothetical protein